MNDNNSSGKGTSDSHNKNITDDVIGSSSSQPASVQEDIPDDVTASSTSQPSLWEQQLLENDSVMTSQPASLQEDVPDDVTASLKSQPACTIPEINVTPVVNNNTNTEERENGAITLASCPSVARPRYRRRQRCHSESGVELLVVPTREAPTSTDLHVSKLKPWQSARTRKERREARARYMKESKRVPHYDPMI